MLLLPLQFGPSLFVSYYYPCSLVRVMTILLVTIVLQRCYHSLLCLASVGWLDFKVYLINKITDL